MVYLCACLLCTISLYVLCHERIHNIPTKGTERFEIVDFGFSCFLRLLLHSLHIHRSPDVDYIICWCSFFSHSLLLIWCSCYSSCYWCHFIRAIQLSIHSVWLSLLLLLLLLGFFCSLVSLVCRCVRALSGRRVQDCSFKNSRSVT